MARCGAARERDLMTPTCGLRLGNVMCGRPAEIVLRVLDDTGQVDPSRFASPVCPQCAPIGAALLGRHGWLSMRQPVREWLDEQQGTAMPGAERGHVDRAPSTGAG
jgi:hypothetical protein